LTPVKELEAFLSPNRGFPLTAWHNAFFVLNDEGKNGNAIIHDIPLQFVDVTRYLRDFPLGFDEHNTTSMNLSIRIFDSLASRPPIR
jgi:hypothetical protein